MALTVTSGGEPLHGQRLTSGPVELAARTGYRVTALAVTADGQSMPATWRCVTDGREFLTTATVDLTDATLGPLLLAVTVTTRGTTTIGHRVTVVAPRTPLSWAPGPLTDPETIVVTDTNRGLHLDPKRDYVIRLPGSVGHPQRTPLRARGGFGMVGGRNVHIIGGAIAHDVDYLTGSTGSRGTVNRGMALFDWTGDLHVEGVQIGGGWLFEGINVRTPHPDARLIAQNLRFPDPILALVGGGHEGGDAIQNWDGPAGGYYVDGLSVYATSYQALFMQPTQLNAGRAPRAGVLRRVSIDHWPEAERAARPLPDAPYLPPRGWGSGGVQIATSAGPWIFDDVWANPHPKLSSARQAWWPTGSVATRPDGTRYIAAATRSTINGQVQIGLPPGGHFVSAADAGIDYVSPGYHGPTPARA